jgi:hypothetical protein
MLSAGWQPVRVRAGTSTGENCLVLVSGAFIAGALQSVGGVCWVPEVMSCKDVVAQLASNQGPSGRHWHSVKGITSSSCNNALAGVCGM